MNNINLNIPKDKSSFSTRTTNELLMNTENQAKKIVDTITKVTSVLRSIPEFDPTRTPLSKKGYNKAQAAKVLSTSTPSSTSSSTSASASSSNEIVHLFKVLKENHVLTQVQDATQTITFMDEKEKQDWSSSSSSLSSLSSHPLERERFQIVHEIILPLLYSLAQTYTILDAETATTSTTNNNDDHDDDHDDDQEGNTRRLESIIASATTTTNSSIQNKSKRNNNKHKPKAPRGLLSLSDYTDIAALLELLVCTSILPLLEANVIPNIQDRLQHIPQTIQGRLRKKSLVWGMNVLEQTKQYDKQQKQQQKQKQLQLQTDVNMQEKITNSIQKIQNASIELSLVSNIISQIILLDRFRPMLLPRHVTDVYAVLFQLERLNSLEKHLRETLSRISSSASPSISASSLSLSSLVLWNKRMKEKQLNDVKWLHYIYLQDTFINHITPIISTTTSSATSSSAAAGASIAEELLTTCQNHILHNIQTIDLYTKVKSFQSLLLSGKKAPIWLKVRVGTLFTSIATSSREGLQSIIDIFVVAASTLPTEEITGASSRLAKVLHLSGGDNNDGYYKSLLVQFVMLLDNCIMQCNDSCSGSGDGHSTNEEGSIIDETIGTRTVGVILTLWAVLEETPQSVLIHFFFPLLVKGLYPSSSSLFLNQQKDCQHYDMNMLLSSQKSLSSIRTTIRRIKFMLQYPPPGSFSTDHVLKKFCQYLLSCSIINHDDNHSIIQTASSSEPSKNSALGQILRVACCSQGDKVIQCDSVRDASDTFRIIVLSCLSSRCNFQGDSSSSMNEKLCIEHNVSIAILQCVAINSFDLLNYKFLRRPNPLMEEGGEGVRRGLGDDIVLEKKNDFNVDFIHEMDNRVQFILRNIVKEFPNGNMNDDDAKKLNRLPSVMFRLLLLIYFESSQLSNNNEQTNDIPLSIRRNVNEYKIPSMMMLSPLCETCSPASLLLDDEDNGPNSSGVIQVIILIIHSVSKAFSVVDPHENIDEAHLSITSIVLSLLIAMLELGSKKRSDHEEEELIGLIPSLQALAMVHETVVPIISSEIAEMASHAMALVSSRDAREDYVDSMTSVEELSIEDFIKKKIDEAERQLSSDQPPLRARAVVLLRQLVRGPLEELLKDHKQKDTQSPSTLPLIVELNDDYKTITENVEQVLHLVHDIIRVCVKALEDTESYVFLASIQTIVAVADVCPSHSMPILIEAISSGKVMFFVCHSPFGVETQLTSAQRIKITEALIFTIKRRGEAIRLYGSMLMNSILYSRSELSAATANNHHAGLFTSIQHETEKYFRGSDETQGRLDDYDESFNDIEEKGIRVNTGGPVFNTEENDVVRSACISVVVQLLSSMHSADLEPYCQLLIRLGINALRLDYSRIVRRAAAALCRELYFCSLREIGDDISSITVSSIKFSIALVAGDEALLFATLKRCIAADDVDMISSRRVLVSSVKGKTRLYDAAIIARCEEALDARTNLMESGVVDAIKLYLHSLSFEKNSPISSLLSKGLDKSNKSSCSDFLLEK